MSAVEILEKLATNTDLTFDRLSDEQKRELNKYLGDHKRFDTSCLSISVPDEGDAESI